MQKNTPNPASFAFDQKSPAKNGKLRRRPLRAKSLSSLESRKQSPKRSSKLLSEKRGPPWACLFSLSILVAIIVIMFSSVFLVSAPRRKMPRADSSAPENTQAHYPVIIIPGLLGSGLEIWKSDVCTGSSFRAKIWGSAAMIKQAVIDSDCLFRHLSLNYTTGLDPDGVKVRASFGLEGADFLMGIYWIFQPLIEELASIGYDPNNMFVALYDWRMSAQNMEIRDHFFTKLKSTIEIAYKTSVGRKVVICAHSYGALVFYQFLNWVQSSIGGRANAHWVETHIHAFVNIAGPLLGVPKSLSTLMSADMKNTAELLAPFQYLKDKVWGRSMLVKLFRSWGSISDMLPKGGIRIWGNTESAPDDLPDKSSFGTMLRFTHSQPVNEAAEDRCQGPSSEYNLESVESFTDNVKDVTKKQSLNVDESLDLLREIAPNFMNKVDNSTSFGLADKDFEISNAPKYWSNPLKSQLPRAPSMKIYCFYGVNKTTERSYNYQPRQGGSCSRVPFQIDTNSEGNGVICSNGDGTVPLLSLGFVCAGAWKHRRFNPAGIPVVTKEYLHDPRDLFGGGDLRGGPTSGDHVDILGNHELIEDILQIVSNSQRPPKTRIISEISTIVKNIDLN